MFNCMAVYGRQTFCMVIYHEVGSSQGGHCLLVHRDNEENEDDQ